MKRNIAKTFLLLAVLALATAASQAQQVNLTANVPFDFTVGKLSFPAGAYAIQRLSPDVLVLSNQSNQLSTLLLPQAMVSIPERSSSSLTFERSEGRSALSEIWADSNGYKVPVVKSITKVAQATTEKAIVEASLDPAK